MSHESEYSPPRTGRAMMAPMGSIARWRGASLFKVPWVLDTL